MSVVVVGLSHRTIPLELLERMTLAESDLPKALRDLRERAHLVEAVIVSTCQRTEIYAEVDRFHGALGEVRHFLADISGVAVDDFVDHLYAHYDEGAVAHLFEVASGLDSAVVGEGEILAQVRTAWELARAEGAAGPILSGLFRHAVEVGKRARTDTAISRGTTSVSQAAVALAAGTLDGLADRTVVVVGAGTMGEGMADTVADRGAGRLLVANRSAARAAALARRVGGSPVHFSDLPAAVAQADVVLTCTGSPVFVLSADDVAAAMTARPGRPLLIVDVAVPRDVEPAVADIAGVTLLDMDDLRSFAEAALAGRRAEISLVRDIVAEEVDRYSELVTARLAAPLVAALHQRAEDVRLAELERFKGRLASLDPRQREAVEALSRGILAKVLHEPTVRLKDEAGTARGERLAEALRTLFDL
ncbi:MAG TPA: glutamyl-tRNA reductase [Acidimicrobiales bacterium]|nr:glutamyl-tRNA reductase [Acidimicrobiales bacterium]